MKMLFLSRENTLYNSYSQCTSLPGFNIKANWGSIASQSSYFYDWEGNKSGRGVDEGKMWAEIATLRGNKGGNLKSAKHAPTKSASDGPRCGACGSTDHARDDCPVWPRGVGEALERR